MRNAEYILDNLSVWNEIPAVGITGGQICYHRDNGFSTEDFWAKNQDLSEILLEKARNQKLPVMYSEENIFFYSCVYDGTEDAAYLIGPIVMQKLPRWKLREYRSLSDFCQGKLFPVSSYEEWIACINLLYFAVFGEQLDDEMLLKENNCEISSFYVPEYEKDTYQLESENEKGRWLYETEEKCQKAMIDGETADINELDLLSHSGKMAEDPFKQAEYQAVCMITVTTRTAIEAGVSSYKAYNLSDLYLQKLEKAKSPMEIRMIMGAAAEEFTQLIQKEKMQGPYYISVCKNYILRNRTKNISINDLAKEVGVSQSYLSRTFKEHEGVTIKEFILTEKCKAVANMLCYSDYSITEIAAYIGFSSVSHMGVRFKKMYHMSPREYKILHKKLDDQEWVIQ